MTLPVFGNIGLSVHRGYRVFDLRRLLAIKVFRSDVDVDIVANEIEAVRTASRLSFAPGIRRWNLKERWYEEVFVDGQPEYPIPNSDPAELLKIYHNHFAHFIKEMILLQPPVRVNLGDYLNSLHNILDNERLLSPNLDNTKINAVRSFVSDLVEKLRNTNRCSLDLIFSHGDFSFVNVLNTSAGMRIIDWESGARRHLLNDLYNYFFTELYYDRVRTNLVAEIKAAISSLQSSLETDAPDLACDLLSSATYYRHLYYLERIKMLLERDLDDHILNVVIHSIEIFNGYEEATGQQRFATS